MGESVGITHRTIGFESPDGRHLVGDVAVPGSVLAGAVLCHPHPQYGGNRFDNVVTALYDELPASGIAALRFDFREAFEDGVGERLDALAALHALAAVVGETSRSRSSATRSEPGWRSDSTTGASRRSFPSLPHSP